MLGARLERTAAVNTTIITLNNLFIDVNDKKLTPVLIELSGGIKFANNDTKENRDVVKLASACKRSTKYITATTDLTVPVPEYVVRFYGA